MRVYVSSHDRWAALHVAGVLSAAGHAIASTWHDDTLGFRNADSSMKAWCAESNVEQITSADALVLVAARDKVPGGKFVEAGVAIGQGKPVYILGQRENILLHHPNAKEFARPEDIAKALS